MVWPFMASPHPRFLPRLRRRPGPQRLPRVRAMSRCQLRHRRVRVSRAGALSRPRGRFPRQPVPCRQRPSRAARPTWERQGTLRDRQRTRPGMVYSRRRHQGLPYNRRPCPGIPYGRRPRPGGRAITGTVRVPRTTPGRVRAGRKITGGIRVSGTNAGHVRAWRTITGAVRASRTTAGRVRAGRTITGGLWPGRTITAGFRAGRTVTVGVRPRLHSASACLSVCPADVRLAARYPAAGGPPGGTGRFASSDPAVLARARA